MTHDQLVALIQVTGVIASLFGLGCASSSAVAEWIDRLKRRVKPVRLSGVVNSSGGVSKGKRVLDTETASDKIQATVTTTFEEWVKNELDGLHAKFTSVDRMFETKEAAAQQDTQDVRSKLSGYTTKSDRLGSISVEVNVQGLVPVAVGIVLSGLPEQLVLVWSAWFGWPVIAALACLWGGVWTAIGVRRTMQELRP